MAIDSYEDVPVNDEQSLQKAVANQPVSVAIEAGGRTFQLYDSVKLPQDNAILYFYQFSLFIKLCYGLNYNLIFFEPMF